MAGWEKTNSILGFLTIEMKTLVIASAYRDTKLVELEEFWDSLKNQSFHQFTLCIFIDGPISRALESRLRVLIDTSFFPVHMIKSESNRGLSVALNSMIVWGLSNNFDIMIRADTDDTFPGNRFLHLVEFLSSNPAVDAVGSNYNYFGIRRGVSSLPLSCQAIRDRFSYSCAIGHATVAFRKSFFEKAGFYEQGCKNLIEDQRLWAAAFRNNCTICNLPQILYNVRVTSGLIIRRASISEKLELYFLRIRHIAARVEPCKRLPFAIISTLNLVVSIILIILILLIMPLRKPLFLMLPDMK